MQTTTNETTKPMMLYVGNLSYTKDENGLRYLFSKFGKVKSVKVIVNYETGKSKGIAFVKMDSNKAGREAIQKLDGTDLDGRKVKVSEAIEQNNNKVRHNNRNGFKKRIEAKQKLKKLIN